MRLQESQLRRAEAQNKLKKTPLSQAIEALGGACRLVVQHACVLDPAEASYGLPGSDLAVVVDSDSNPRLALALRDLVDQSLKSSLALAEMTQALQIRDNTMKQICEVMASYSQQNNSTADFIESLGPDIRYAVFRESEVVINHGFTEQALLASLGHLRDTNAASIRVRDGELYACKFPPYQLVVESAQPIAEPLKHLMQIYVQQLGHRERTELARQAEQKVDRMEWLANHDALTALGNRRLLNQVANKIVEKELLESDRHAAIFLDLDGFKFVNDTFGHEVGDELLKHVAGLVRRVCHQEDFIARVGGDEFVILRPFVSDIRDIENLAQSLVVNIGKPAIINNKHCNIGVSIGISWWSNQHNDATRNATDWISDADRAMYDVKKNGKADYRVA